MKIIMALLGTDVNGKTKTVNTSIAILNGSLKNDKNTLQTVGVEDSELANEVALTSSVDYEKILNDFFDKYSNYDISLNEFRTKGETEWTEEENTKDDQPFNFRKKSKALIAKKENEQEIDELDNEKVERLFNELNKLIKEL